MGKSAPQAKVKGKIIGKSTNTLFIFCAFSLVGEGTDFHAKLLCLLPLRRRWFLRLLSHPLNSQQEVMKPEIMLSCDTALERQHESHADSATRGTSKTVSAPTLIPEGECHAMLLKIKEQRRIAEYALSSLEKGERQNMGSLPAVMSGDKEESFRATIDAHILDDIKQEAANIHPAYNRDEDDNYPNHFCCPITMKPLCRPVVVKASGRTYEMDAIVAWLTKNSVEPMTQHTLEGPIESLYVFNYALKESMDFFDEYKRKRIVARRRALVDATIRDMFIFSRENNQRSYTAMVENVAEREYLKQIIQNYKDEEHRLGFSCILGITD